MTKTTKFNGFCKICGERTEHNQTITTITGGAVWSNVIQCTRCAYTH